MKQADRVDRDALWIVAKVILEERILCVLEERSWQRQHLVAALKYPWVRNNKTATLLITNLLRAHPQVFTPTMEVLWNELLPYQRLHAASTKVISLKR